MVMPNNQTQTDDFTYDEYFKIFLENLKAGLARGEITQEQYYQQAADMINITQKRNARLESLPFYYDWRTTWTSRLPLTLGGKAHISPGGQLWDTGGNPYDPATAQKMLSDYWAVESTDMTPYEQSQVQLSWAKYNRDLAGDTESKRQWNLQYNQALAATNESQRRWETEQGQSAAESAAAQSLRERQFSWQQTTDAAQLAQQRAETLAQLKSQPQSWIEAYLYERAGQPSPGTPAQDALVRSRANNWITRDQAKQAEEELYTKYPQLQGSLNSVRAWWPNITDPEVLRDAQQVFMAQQKAQETQAAVEQAQNLYSSEGSAERQALQGWRRAQLPPTPEWMPSYVPGLEAGEPITKERARVASGQLWGQTPWSQRQMLGGYLQWASPYGPPTLTDYEQMVESMLPQKAEKTPRWISALQR